MYHEKRNRLLKLLQNVVLKIKTPTNTVWGSQIVRHPWCVCVCVRVRLSGPTSAYESPKNHMFLSLCFQCFWSIIACTINQIIRSILASFMSKQMAFDSKVNTKLTSKVNIKVVEETLYHLMYKTLSISGIINYPCESGSQTISMQVDPTYWRPCLVSFKLQCTWKPDSTGTSLPFSRLCTSIMKTV